LDDASRDLRRKTHETIGKTTDDIARRYTFNTAIAAIMELLNTVQKLDAQSGQSLAVEREALVRDCVVIRRLCRISVKPYGKHWVIAMLSMPAWPTVDESALTRSSIELMIQVNGKLRGKI
jgi:leucyl-tRNA synthetase